MANIEHSSIPDVNLHQCKGAASAEAGAYLRARGDGTTEWLPTHGILCNKFNPIAFSSGSWFDLSWDSTLVSNGVTRSGATITISRSGVYIISYSVLTGSPAKGEARVVKDGVELPGSARCFESSASVLITPVQTTFGAVLSAGDTIKTQMYVHSPASGSIGYISGGVADTKSTAEFYLYSLPS